MIDFPRLSFDCAAENFVILELTYDRDAVHVDCAYMHAMIFVSMFVYDYYV